MPMPAEIRAKQAAYTAALTRTVQNIINDNSVTPRKQAEKIKELDGTKKEDMFKFLNDNFRVNPDLADSIKSIISKGPSITTKLKSLSHKGN